MAGAHRHDWLLVFDCETVPDTDCAGRLTGCHDTDPVALQAALERHQAEVGQVGSPFLKPVFHRVVAIGFLLARIDRPEPGRERYTLERFECCGASDWEERRLLSGFFTATERKRPRLVSFNGRSFDLPVLRLRAMRHELAFPALHGTEDRWEHYGHRYSADWHCDLKDVLGDFGAAKAGKLNDLCVVLGLPGKIGPVSGETVAEMHRAGRLREIRDYCEADVLNTYLLYLRWMLYRGTLSGADYIAASLALRTRLASEAAGGREHCGRFLDAWPESQVRLAAEASA